MPRSKALLCCSGAWVVRSEAALLSPTEMQLNTHVPPLQPAELPPASVVALRTVQDRLCTVYHSVRWRRRAGGSTTSSPAAGSGDGAPAAEQ